MWSFHHILLVSTAVATVACTGCGRKAGADTAPMDAKAVQQRFESAPPEVKQTVTASAQAIQAAATEQDISVKAAHYTQALQPMGRVLARGNLTKEQTQVLLNQFQQINKAVQNDPRLAADKQLYQARNAAAQALHRSGVRP